MFNLQGKKNYRVAYIIGGTSAKGSPYSFITAEEEPVGAAKFGARLKINIWGVDLSDRIKQDDYIKLVGATEVGIVKKKDAKSDKWFENLTITCEPEDVLIGAKPEEKTKEQPTQKFEPIDDDNLPF